MEVDDPGLALLLVVPPVTAAVYSATGDGVVTGALLGVLMALLVAGLDVRFGVFGDPGRRGLGGRR